MANIVADIVAEGVVVSLASIAVGLELEVSPANNYDTQGHIQGEAPLPLPTRII